MTATVPDPRVAAGASRVSRLTSPCSRARWLVPVLPGGAGGPARTGLARAADRRDRTACAPARASPGRWRCGSRRSRRPRSRGRARCGSAASVTNTSHEAWQDINVQRVRLDRRRSRPPRGWSRPPPLPYDADVGDRLTRPATRSCRSATCRRAGRPTFSLRIPRSELPIPDQPRRLLGRRARARHRQAGPRQRRRRSRPHVRPALPRDHPQDRRHAGGAVPCPGAPRQHGRAARRRSAGNACSPRNGRLERILGVRRERGIAPVTLVVDPAVLDAVDTLAGAPHDPIAGGVASPSPSATPGGEASETTGTAVVRCHRGRERRRGRTRRRRGHARGWAG